MALEEAVLLVGLVSPHALLLTGLVSPHALLSRPLSIVCRFQDGHENGLLSDNHDYPVRLNATRQPLG